MFLNWIYLEVKAYETEHETLEVLHQVVEHPKTFLVPGRKSSFIKLLCACCLCALTCVGRVNIIINFKKAYSLCSFKSGHFYCK